MREPTKQSARSPRGAGAEPAPRRADAQRNITAILDAALICVNQGTEATMTEIAQAAGVGRVTLYGHFASREAVLEALLTRSLAEADSAFAQLDLDGGSAPEALSRLLHAPWLLGRYRGLYAAATRHLGPEHVRRLHDTVFARVERLVARGQDEGAFRTDLPRPWLIATAYALAHAAVTEVDTDRMTSDQAAGVLTTTLLSVLTPANGESRDQPPMTGVSSAPRRAADGGVPRG